MSDVVSPMWQVEPVFETMDYHKRREEKTQERREGESHDWHSENGGSSSL